MKLKMKQAGWIIFLSALSGMSAMAQKVTIDAELRPRTEFRDGFTSPLVRGANVSDNRAAALMLQRTRLGASYESNALNAKITLQDARVFGAYDKNGQQLSSDTINTFGVYEAWAELLVLPGTSFKIGRQALQFEDGRIFSASAWSNTGSAHDMAQLKYSMPGFDVQAGYAFSNNKLTNADAQYNQNGMYKQLAFLHGAVKLTKGLDFTFLGVDDAFQENSAKTASTSSSKTDLNLFHRYTYGGTLSFKTDSLPLSAFLTGYYQTGKASQTINLEAYMLAAKLGYDINSKLSSTLGVDYYSGSKTTMNATHSQHTFQKLYSANHSFNGFMEYWAKLPKGGLINYYGGLTYKFTDKLSTDANYYAFFLARDMLVKNKATNKNEVVKNNLGSEIDLVLNYKMSAETAIQLGWCHYLVTDGTILLKTSDSRSSFKMPQYAYLMFTIKPKFLVSK